MIEKVEHYLDEKTRHDRVVTDLYAAPPPVDLARKLGLPHTVIKARRACDLGCWSDLCYRTPTTRAHWLVPTLGVDSCPLNNSPFDHRRHPRPSRAAATSSAPAASPWRW